MSIVFAATIDIAATPEEAWEVLSDFSTYGEWSNFSRVDRTPGTRGQAQDAHAGFWFSSTVTAVTENHELQWSAKIIKNGLFLGAHNVILDRNEDGTTRVTNTETFSGALTKPFEGLFAKKRNDGGYAKFNEALKSRVETRTAQRGRFPRPQPPPSGAATGCVEDFVTGEGSPTSVREIGRSPCRSSGPRRRARWRRRPIARRW